MQTGKYPVVKLYAYEQKVSGGANFSSDTKGRAVMKKYVYLLLRNDRTIEIEKVWISCGISFLRFIITFNQN